MRVERGYLFSIISVSEGATPVRGGQVFSREGDEIYVPRLGGIGQVVGEYIERQGFETRVTVLGHLQRGIAGWRLVMAPRQSARGGFDRIVALRAGKIVDIPLEEAIAAPKRVDVNDDAILSARGMGIPFGVG